MGSSSDLVSYYAWPSTVNIANFVTVKPCMERDGRSNFKIWREQMLCLLESQDVAGFVDGEILPPPPENYNAEWRRTDRLVKGWLLGSIGKDVLHAVWEKPTARDVWLQLDNIFKEEKKEEEEVKEEEKEKEEEEQAKKNRRGDMHLKLYKAAQRGDTDTAHKLFRDCNLDATAIVNDDSETALHVAVYTGNAIDFVKMMLELMPPEALGLSNTYGNTALHKAAMVGNTEAAMAMIDKNRNLLYIRNNNDRLAVLQAAVYCHKKTLEYLISKSDPNVFERHLGAQLLTAVLASQFYDVALELVYKYPNLATERYYNSSALSTLTAIPSTFLSRESFSWWQSLIYPCIPIKKSKCGAADHTTSIAGDIENLSYNYSTSFQINISGGKVWKKVKSMIWNVIDHLVPQVKDLREKKTTHREALQLVEHLCHKTVSLPQDEATAIFSTSILKAAENGFSEIVEMIIHNYPTVAGYRDKSGRNIFLLAANNRFENVINLLHNMGDRKELFIVDGKDYRSNNLMHICGYLAPSGRLNLVPGAALQMQRELQWFKEMEKFVHPSRRIAENDDGQTPQMIFTKEHEKLKADGERWMKDTANACTIAAALIATVVFAAAFTVPGGLESATGIPLFSTKPAFVVFAVSDAVSLFTSTTSLLMFLSILTSRYAEEDFLYVLPKRLALGLLSLFVSISFMLVAFSAALYLLLQGHLAWFVVLVAAFACLPVTSFVLLQFPLLVDVVYSTYGPGIFAKKTGRFHY